MKRRGFEIVLCAAVLLVAGCTSPAPQGQATGPAVGPLRHWFRPESQYGNP